VIDCGVRLDVGVAEHTFNVAGIDFNDKVADADKVEARGTERVEETVQFEFRLRVVRLALVPQDGAETRRAAAAVGTVLHENPSNAMH